MPVAKKQALCFSLYFLTCLATADENYAYDRHLMHALSSNLKPALSAKEQTRVLGAQDQALFQAVHGNDGGAVAALLAKGANINARDDEGRTPAMWALLRGNRETLRVLMSAGLDHSTQDSQGQSIFDYFSRFGVLSNERMANASCVIAGLAVEDALAPCPVATVELPSR